MTVDLVVKGGRVVTSKFTFKGAIAVDHGKIVGIMSNATAPSADRVIDAEGLFVLPGIVDAHVHFREPGFEYKEDFATGSAAAVFGGVTSVCDMPNVNPATQDAASFRLKLQRGLKKSLVDFGIFGVVLPSNLEKISELKQAGVVGYKIFMGETVGNLPSPDDWDLYVGFKEIAETGLRVGVHAENRSMTTHLASELKSKARNDPLALLEARPSISEAEAIQRAVLLASPFGTKLHIHHTSSKEGLEVIRRSRAMGASLTAETCPHYLLIDGVKYLKEKGSLVKMYPPVRGIEHSSALWRGLREGLIDMIASDHSPHSLEEKSGDNVWEVIAGWPGVETFLPLMLNEANNRRLTLNEIVLYMSEGPARVWGFYPKKGALNLKSDGDLTIVDMKKEHTIESEGLHSKNRFTPFEGWKIKGMPVYTIVRGNVLLERGEFCSGTHEAQLIVPGRSVCS